MGMNTLSDVKFDIGDIFLGLCLIIMTYTCLEMGWWHIPLCLGSFAVGVGMAKENCNCS